MPSGWGLAAHGGAGWRVLAVGGSFTGLPQVSTGLNIDQPQVRDLRLQRFHIKDSPQTATNRQFVKATQDCSRFVYQSRRAKRKRASTAIVVLESPLRSGPDDRGACGIPQAMRKVRAPQGRKLANGQAG